MHNIAGRSLMTLYARDAHDKPAALSSQRHYSGKFKNQTLMFFRIHFNKKVNSLLGQSAIILSMERTNTDRVIWKKRTQTCYLFLIPQNEDYVLVIC